MGCGAFLSGHGRSPLIGCNVCFRGYVSADTPCPRATEINESQRREVEFLMNLAGSRRKFFWQRAGSTYQRSSYGLVFTDAEGNETCPEIFDYLDVGRITGELIGAGFAETDRGKA